MTKKTCAWIDRGNGIWGVECGNNHYLDPEFGSPTDYGMQFCCYCGLPLVESGPIEKKAWDDRSDHRGRP
jgi:hypothetical protein